MANRLTTTNVAAEANFTPTGETILQLDTEVTGAKVEVLARVDGSAKWVQVGVMSAVAGKLIRLPQYPFLKLSMTGNTNGKAVNVWSN